MPSKINENARFSSVRLLERTIQKMIFLLAEIMYNRAGGKDFEEIYIADGALLVPGPLCVNRL